MTLTMGDRLKELRRERSLSQEIVAQSIGITRSAYSHYEINNRQPVYETLIKLASFFEVTTDFIIDGDTRSTEPQVAADAAEIIRLLNNMDVDKRKESIDKMLDAIRES
ncbi:helix-turn-helix transcriptional regulator [Paenibacillus sp. JDR-2]|uniref:helix-turn-helix transcriptional regulator n=1 Tax=Paenibacillus sp. (strain JDR-2) TaxID=324057 RepID=UPI0001666331|nr:helix-turn-helix transcriptional regulator [Paenibacillus sp. JDR-2]ACT01155.1 transcriptional regulator, XRE family [Paenibacillus sp. JDR-2]